MKAPRPEVNESEAMVFKATPLRALRFRLGGGWDQGGHGDGTTAAAAKGALVAGAGAGAGKAAPLAAATAGGGTILGFFGAGLLNDEDFWGGAWCGTLRRVVSRERSRQAPASVVCGLESL